MLKVLSLGWGIQSFTIAAMMALKEIEPADVIIHADTTHESKLTYEFREKWEPFLIKSGLNVVTVINNTASKTDIINKYGGIIIPAYSVFQDRVGMIKRQCTDNWKRNPIKRYIQSIRNKQQVRMMIGISIDEWTRAKDAKEQYIVNEWPLIQNKISRNQCIEWLVDNNFEVPTKSACTFCPFKADSEWISTKKRMRIGIMPCYAIS